MDVALTITALILFTWAGVYGWRLGDRLAVADARLDELRRALGDDPASVQDALARVEMASRDSVTFQARLGEVERRVGAAESRLATLRGDVDRLQAAVGECRTRLDHHDHAAGHGFWRTQEGDVLRIRDMSTHHLLNVLDSGLGTGAARARIAVELRRRWRDLDFLAATLETLDLPSDRRAAAARELIRGASAADEDLPETGGSVTLDDYLRKILGDDPDPDGVPSGRSS